MNFESIISASLLTTNFANSMDIKTILRYASIYFGYTLVKSIQTELIPVIKKYIDNTMHKKMNAITTSIHHEPTLQSEIIFSKHLKKSDSDITVDSILDYLCGIDGVKSLKYDHLYTIHGTSIFDVTKNIKAQLLGLRMKEDETEFIEFRVFSDTLTLHELKRWINDLKHQYEIHDWLHENFSYSQ